MIRIRLSAPALSLALPALRSLHSTVPAAWLSSLALLLPVPVAAVGFTSLGPDGGTLQGFAQAPSDHDRMYSLPYRQGVYRSEDHGETWQFVSTGLAPDQLLLQVAISPTDEDFLLVGDPDSDGVRRSTDGGVTWAFSPVASEWNEVSIITFDRHNAAAVLVAIQDGPQPGIYRSTDGGASFAASPVAMAGSAPTAIAFHPLLPGVVLGGNDSGIFRSTDGGVTWSLVYSGYVVSVAYCEGSPSRAWGLTGGAALRSTDAGVSFAPTVSQPPKLEWDESYVSVAAHPANPDVALIGQVYWSCGGDCFPLIVGVSKTTNGGGTWSNASYDPGTGFWGDRFLALAFDAGNPATVFAAISGDFGLRRAEGSSVTFNPWMSGIHGVGILAVDRDGEGTIYARAEGEKGLWRAPDAGSPFEERVTPGPYVTCFEPHRAIPGLLHEAGVVTSMDTASPVWSTSTNGGQTWGFGDSPPASLFSFPALLRSSTDGQTVYIWTDDWGAGWMLHRSVNGFSFSTSVSSFPPAGAVVDPNDAMRLFGVDRSSGVVRLSSDGGVTWSPRSAGLPSGTSVDLFMDPDDADRLAVVYRTAGAFRSEDAGLTWTAAPVALGGSIAVAADWDPVLDRFAIATLADGVFITGLGLVTDGLPTRALTDIVFDPTSGKVLVGTAHASVQAIDAPDPTGTPVVANAAVAALRIAPNPFQSVTMIHFTAPEAREVSIDVIGIDGRRVVALRAQRRGGEMVASWDGRDATGTSVAPGVYFVRAQVLGQTAAAARVVRIDRSR